MVLTDRQRTDLHASIYEYALLQDGEAFAKVAAAMKEADPAACTKDKPDSTPLLEKKWTAIPRLQKKVLELERLAAQNAKIHAHRSGVSSGSSGADAGSRRMLPRLPSTHTLQGHSAVVTSVKVHPVFTVAVSGSEDGTIKVWDHESGDYVRTLKGHTNTVTALAFPPTGSHLASSSTDLSIKLWDFSTYSCIRTLRGHDHTISAIGFIPAPSDTSSGPKTLSMSSSMATETTADLAGSQFLVSASRDTTVKVWDIETGFCEQTLGDHHDWVRCLAVRQHDGAFATAGNDTVIQVYSRERTKITEFRGHEHVVEALGFVTESADAKSSKASETYRDYLVSGGRDRSVRLWKLSSMECLATFTAHENWVRAVQLHPSGNYVVSAGDDRTIRVLDIKANRCLRTLESAHSHFVTSLSLHPTLPILVSGSVDTTVKCWMLD